MQLYFHVDRGQRLSIGDIIEKEPYPDESILQIFAPFFDQGFIDHILRLCKDGLSLHGAAYLIQISHGNINFVSFTTELYFEYIRYKYYNHLPSRLQSLFAFRKYTDALEFAKLTGLKGKIFQINFTGDFFIGDMNLLKLNFDVSKQEEYARRYWESKPYLTDASYIPNWEYVINLPVEVMSEVLVNPLD